LTNNNKSVIITPSKETRKRIKQSKKFIQFIAYINVPMKRMKIKEGSGDSIGKEFITSSI